MIKCFYKIKCYLKIHIAVCLEIVLAKLANLFIFSLLFSIAVDSVLRSVQAKIPCMVAYMMTSWGGGGGITAASE